MKQATKLKPATLKPFKLGNKYKVVKDLSKYSGSKVLGLKVGDEIDTGYGRFMIDCDGDVFLECGKYAAHDGVVASPKEDRQYSHYYKDVSKLGTIDVYQVLDLFNVTNPCLQHIVKKALVTGGRTAGKDFSQDLREIRDTAIRAVEMYEQSKAD